MSYRKLTYKETRELAYLLRDIYKYIQTKDPKGLIKNPQIPSVLSENLAKHMLEQGILEELVGYTFRHGEKKADLVAQKVMDYEEILIEVKATGNKNFIEIRPKDIKADYMIWFCFEDYFSKQDSNLVDMFVFKKPEVLGIKAGRITRDDLMKNLTDIPKFTFEFEPLKQDHD